MIIHNSYPILPDKAQMLYQENIRIFLQVDKNI